MQNIVKAFIKKVRKTDFDLISLRSLTAIAIVLVTKHRKHVRLRSQQATSSARRKANVRTSAYVRGRIHLTRTV